MRAVSKAPRAAANLTFIRYVTPNANKNLTIQMASQQNSREYTALKRNVRVLAGVVAQGMIPTLLFENDVIDEEMWGFACDRTIAVTNRDRGNKVMKQVLQAVREDPTLFEVFCAVLDTEREGKNALQKVKGRPVFFP